MKNWTDQCIEEANALPIERQQEFLDLMWKGMTIGAAREKAQITFNAANGIVQKNILNTSYLSKQAIK